MVDRANVIIDGNGAGSKGITNGDSGNKNASELDAIAARNAVDPSDFLTGKSGNSEAGSVAETGNPVKRKRGRPAGSGNKKTENSSTVGEESSVEGIAAAIILVHSAVALRVPEMDISEEEAAKLAAAWKRLEKYYPRVAKIFSDKITDHLAFFSALSLVYGPRIAAIGLRIRTEQQKKREETAPVVDMQGQPYKPN